MPVTVAFFIFLGLFSRKMDRKPFFFPCIVDWTHLFHFEILNPFKSKKMSVFWHIQTKASLLLLNLGYLTYCDVILFFLYVWGILSHRYIGLRCIPFSKIHVYRWTTGSFWALWRALHFFKKSIFLFKDCFISASNVFLMCWIK